MAMIGSFRKAGERYKGVIRTLAVRKRRVELRPIAKRAGSDPDFRVTADGVEIGAAWKRAALESQREYLAVRLDDPRLRNPIYANLFEADDQRGYRLMWSR